MNPFAKMLAARKNKLPAQSPVAPAGPAPLPAPFTPHPAPYAPAAAVPAVHGGVPATHAPHAPSAAARKIGLGTESMFHAGKKKGLPSRGGMRPRVTRPDLPVST